MKSRRWKIACLSLSLAAATLLLYGRTAGYPFINYDDHAYVTDNPHVTQGLTWENLGWAFRSGYAANWHPLTWVSHQLDVQLFGMKAGAMHLVSALFHAGNAALLLLVFFRLTGAVGRSAMVAALFAWHPAHVESVAWIAERKDVLSLFFWLLTMLAYQRYATLPGLRRYLLVALFLTLGLMAKPMVVTLPCVLLLLDYWPLQRPRQVGRLLLEKLPLLALSAAASAITFLVQRTGGAVVSLQGEPLASRLGKALFAYCFYLGKIFWPAELFVPYWDDFELTALPLAAAALGLILLTGAALRYRARCPYLLVGWLWFLGTFVPVIGIVQVGSQSAADRYTYIPSIGLFIAVTWGAADLAARGRAPRSLVGAGAAAVLGACVFLAFRQIGYWRNSETLFQHTLALDPPNLIAIDLLAWTYATDLDPKLRNGAKALELASFTVRVTERRDGWSLATLAAADAENGQFAAAIATAEEALLLPDTQRQPQLVTDLRDNLELYRAGKAIHPR